MNSKAFPVSLLPALLLPAVALAGEVRMPEEGHAYNPIWSSNGKYLAYEVNGGDSGTIHLFVSEVAGGIAKDGVAVNLPAAAGGGFGAGKQVVMNPTWHPAGPALFEGSNSGGEYRIYLYNPGGASATEQFKQDKAPGNLTFPVVSKDGKFAAFVSSATGNGDLMLWTTSGNLFTRLTDTEGTESFPYFSADSKKLLFTRKANNTEDIFEMDFATKAEKSIVGGGGDQSRPIYAAGGAIVYFSSERGSDHWDLMTVDGAGSKKALAKDVQLPQRSRPALTPDGQWVAWTSNDPTQSNVVQITKIDGSKTVQIQTGFTDCEEPALTVSNGRVMLAYTYLPPGDSSWRKLFVVDVTDKLQ